MDITLIALGILFFGGHALQWIFVKTKVPDLLILVFLGYLLGPLLGIVRMDDLGQVGSVLSTIALVVILYDGGLNLSAKQLKACALPALGITFLSFGLIVTAVFFVAWMFQPWDVAILLALGVGSTSSAIVIPMVKHLSVQEKTKTILALESAFTDVLAIVLFLVLVDAFASGLFSFESVLIGLGPMTLLSVVAGIGLGLIWSFLKKHAPELVEMTFAGEAWVLTSYGMLTLLGMNGAIGVLALGFTLGNLNLLPQRVRGLISPEPVSAANLSLLQALVFLLKTFFFVYLGMLISFGDIYLLLLAVVIAALIVLTRYVSVLFAFRPLSFPSKDAMTAVAMGPRGLACAVLAMVPLQRGLDGGEFIQQVIFSTIPLTIILTAGFVFLVESPTRQAWLKPFFSRYAEGPKEVESATLESGSSPTSEPIEENT